MDSRWFLCAIVFVLVEIVVSQNTRCQNLPDGRFINDFTACDGFFTCFRGEAFPGTCPAGYYFNEEEQLCDFNWRVKCLLCPDDPTAPPTLEPIEGNCDFYTLCFQGIGSLRECAEGTLFDRVLGACAVAETVDCDASVCPSNINPATPVLVPDPADCSSYFICLNGEANQAQCAPTLLFNPETRRCDLEENVECAEGAPSPTSCPATGLHLIGNPADCVSYFVCLDGVQSAAPIDCAPDLIFDVTVAQCRLPDENSRCADGSSPLPVPETLIMTTPGMDSRWFLCAIVFVLVQIVVSQNNRCQNLPDGRFINDFTACDGFFTCFRGEAFPDTCPEGYYFNEEEQLCDFNWRVKCLLCPDDPTAPPTLEPIEGNCDFYTLCFQGIGSLRECADGLLFDRVLGACAVADTVDCEAAACPSNINPETPVLVPDPADCSSYFICLNGEATPAQCAPTLLFNPETRRCDLEENVECAEGAPSPTSCPATGFHLIGNPADCVSYFVCLDGVQSAAPLDCASGLIFDITEGQCRLPDENSRCADGSSPIPEPTLGEAFPGTCPEGYYFNEEEQLCDFNWRVKCMLCPDDPNASPTLEPIEGNCDFYTLCFQGIGTLRECAEGLLFDRVLGACTIADRVDCEAALCPSNVNPATPVLVPDPADCSSYFICLNGEATPAQCAPTLLFNPETRRCDLEENVECINFITLLHQYQRIQQLYLCAIVQCERQQNKMVSKSVLYRALVMASLVATASAQLVGPCAGVQDGVFVNDFSSCEGYFLCENGQPLPAACPPGFFFNEDEQLCDFPQNVFCYVCSQPFGVELYPSPSSCEKFITCSNGVSFEGTCSAGHKFDATQRICMRGDRAQCNTQPGCPAVDNPNEIVFLPGSQSCSEYFLCQAGSAIQRFCAPGLHWNRVAQRCDFPEIAQCPLPQIQH
ncbi:uncharacterized protein LOC118467940 [Anopheles albimanus]|uniref:uncharacterized protein LOC118467940 n=1 Tax=Anopheles albimanus TaxID=7167 RepID=UPI00163E2A17|nr:uncharacterized protein LOC118467940 [Anopheles albimanus]